MRAIHDNLLVNKDGDVWGYFRVKSISISNHDTKQKEQHKLKLSAIYKNLAKFGEFELSLIPKELDLEERFFGETSLSNDFAPDVQHVAKHYASKQIDLLNKEFDTVTESYYIVGVKLKSFQYDQSIRSSVKSVVSQFTQAIATGAGYELEIPEDFYKSYLDSCTEVESILSPLGGEALTENQLTYFIRYGFMRGIKHSIETESHDHFLENISDTALNATKRGTIYMKNTNGAGYVAMLPVSETHVDLKNSLFYEVAQSKKFPVELRMKVMTEQKTGLFGTLKDKLSALSKEIGSEDKDGYMAGQMDRSDKRKMTKFLLNQMKNGVDRDNEYFRFMAVYVVYGKDIQEVRKRVSSLKSTMAKRKVELSTASAQQIDLFYRFIPGYSLLGEKRWLQYASQDGLAENLFGVSHQLGNNTGFVIGRVSNTHRSQTLKKSVYSSKDLVLLNPLVSNQGLQGAATDSPHISITGETGKGKSFLVKLIMMYQAMMKGKMLYIDPKQEIKRWFDRATSSPEFRAKYHELMDLINEFHFTTLDQANRENWGALDPIVFLAGMNMENTSSDPDTDPAYDVAVAMFSQVFPLNNQIMKTHLEKAIKDVITQKWDGEQVGMLTVLDVMEDTATKDEVREMAQAIRNRVSSGILRLSFSDGTNDSVSFKTRINILEVAGLDLPSENQDSATYTDMQKNSLATMFALGKFADKFGRENPDEYTFEIIDEAWIFQTSTMGRAILKSIKRVGRSFNNALIYATQSIADISSEDDHGQVGVVFAFNEPTETEAILDYVGLDSSDKNKEWFENFIKGECLFRDVYGRVGKLAIHSMFPEFTELFKTVKRSESAKAEEKFN